MTRSILPIFFNFSNFPLNLENDLLHSFPGTEVFKNQLREMTRSP